MKLVPFLLCLACTVANAEILVWSPNADTDLVTNYVVRAFGPSIKTSNTGVATSFDLNYLGPGAWSVNVLAQNAVATSDPSVTLTWGSLAPVQNLTVRATWSAGAFDIVATWGASPGAAHYMARLLNLGTSVPVERPVTVTTASWPRMPIGTYRLTVTAFSLNGAASAPVILDLGTLKPGQPRNPQIMTSEPLPGSPLTIRDSTAQPAPIMLGPTHEMMLDNSVHIVVSSAAVFTVEDLRRWFRQASQLVGPTPGNIDPIPLGPTYGLAVDGAQIDFTATTQFTSDDLRKWIREASQQLH